MISRVRGFEVLGSKVWGQKTWGSEVRDQIFGHFRLLGLAFGI